MSRAHRSLMRCNAGAVAALFSLSLLLVDAAGPTLYHTAEEVLHWYSATAEQPNSILRFEKLGDGDEIDKVPLATLGRPKAGSGGLTAALPARPVALLVFGEHSREIITTEVALWLSRLLTGDGRDFHQWHEVERALGDGGLHGSARDAIEELRWYILQHLTVQIVPIENVSGRAQWEAGHLCQRASASGVDLNRNWPFAWRNVSRKSDQYGGRQPFSEPQSRALRDLALRHPPKAFINSHSGEWAVYVPWDSKASYSTGMPEDMQSLLDKTAAVCGCQVGPAGAVSQYLAYGTSMDWMHTALRVPYPMTLEFYGQGKEGLLTKGSSNKPLKAFKVDPLPKASLQGRRRLRAWDDEWDKDAAGENGVRGLRGNGAIRALVQRGSREGQDCFAMYNPVRQAEYRDVVARWVVTLLITLRHIADPAHPKMPNSGPQQTTATAAAAAAVAATAARAGHRRQLSRHRRGGQGQAACGEEEARRACGEVSATTWAAGSARGRRALLKRGFAVKPEGGGGGGAVSSYVLTPRAGGGHNVVAVVNASTALAMRAAGGTAGGTVVRQGGRQQGGGGVPLRPATLVRGGARGGGVSVGRANAAGAGANLGGARGGGASGERAAAGAFLGRGGAAGGTAAAGGGGSGGSSRVIGLGRHGAGKVAADQVGPRGASGRDVSHLRVPLGAARTSPLTAAVAATGAALRGTATARSSATAERLGNQRDGGQRLTGRGGPMRVAANNSSGGAAAITGAVAAGVGIVHGAAAPARGAAHVVGLAATKHGGSTSAAVARASLPAVSAAAGHEAHSLPHPDAGRGSVNLSTGGGAAAAAAAVYERGGAATAKRLGSNAAVVSKAKGTTTGVGAQSALPAVPVNAGGATTGVGSQGAVGVSSHGISPGAGAMAVGAADVSQEPSSAWGSSSTSPSSDSSATSTSVSIDAEIIKSLGNESVTMWARRGHNHGAAAHTAGGGEDGTAGRGNGGTHRSNSHGWRGYNHGWMSSGGWHHLKAVARRNQHLLTSLGVVFMMAMLLVLAFGGSRRDTQAAPHRPSRGGFLQPFRQRSSRFG